MQNFYWFKYKKVVRDSNYFHIFCTLPITLYPAYMVGVPLCPWLPTTYAARRIFPASIPECSGSPLEFLWILERNCRTRALALLYVYYLPPTLRLWLVEHAVAIIRRYADASGGSGDCCRGSDIFLWLRWGSQSRWRNDDALHLYCCRHRHFYSSHTIYYPSHQQAQ